jgi:hypothetical protein
VLAVEINRFLRREDTNLHSSYISFCITQFWNEIASPCLLVLDIFFI